VSYTLVIHNEAYAELDGAERYFGDRSPGLGRPFRAAVGNSLAFILERPFDYAERSSGFRYGIVARFLYRVIYKVQDHVIFVAAGDPTGVCYSTHLILGELTTRLVQININQESPCQAN
jgi:hypothetical protein